MNVEIDNRRLLAVAVDLLVLAPVAVALYLLFGRATPVAGSLMLGWALYYFFASRSLAGKTVGERVVGLPEADPVPEPKPAPAQEAQPQPVAPEPAAGAEPTPVAEPEPVPAPNPVPDLKPFDPPEPEPETPSEPEPQPEPDAETTALAVPEPDALRPEKPQKKLEIVSSPIDLVMDDGDK